ncbi:MAG: hypothetical protein KAI24_00230 [Planctomycetes bacterium]|nr:hypothetical protein [Planctomycetota bacterium]
MTRQSIYLALTGGLLLAPLSAQSVLSDFTGSTDGWSGTINGTTVFPNGFTAANSVTVSGNDVLELSDGGFGGGALRTYTGLPTTGFVTVLVDGRIVTDPGTLNPDPNSNPGTFGTAFGLAAGSAGLEDQAFGYSRSLSTTADDSGQSFASYVATVRADGSGEFTAFFTPEQHDHAVGAGTWVAQLDNVTLMDCNGPTIVLSDFAASSDGWPSITPTTAPFGSAFTGVSDAGGELVLTDGGFTGGAYRTYTGAATSAGVHNVFVDLRIVTDNGSLDRARVAACVGGVTTDYWDLSFSQSFSTTGDDSGQPMQTVAVPVVTSGPADITVYVLADYDASIGGGAWEIRVDEVRVQNASTASTSISTACGPGHHSLNGPVIGFSGAPTLGGTLTVTGANLVGTPLCVMLFGDEAAPIPLTVIGSFPGSQSCVNFYTTVPCGGATTASIPITIPNNPAYCGQSFSAQLVDVDPSMPFPLPLGTSRVGTLTIGL